MTFKASKAFNIIQLKQSVLCHSTAGSLLIGHPSRSSHFTQKISLSLVFAISVTHSLASFNFLCLEFATVSKHNLVLLLLLKLSLALAFTSPFSCTRLPYLDYAAG